MANNHASLTLMLGANIREFQSAMRQASKELQKTGKQMKEIGKSMSMYITAPILAMGAASVIAFDKQAKAIAQVEAGLRSTGGTVGFTSKELQKMASELQNISLFGDEEILQGVTSQLLTFTNITNEQFARTQVAAMDLATRLDGDLKSASIQLGKALNDPVANLSALSRSGIQFSTDQKAMINALVETNRLADAQTIILDELERQYGGSAKAAAEAGAGPLTQLKNIIGDLGEQFGEIIMEYIKPFVAKLKEWAIAFQNLSPATKKIIVLMAGLTAAIGPALIIIGQMSIGIAALATMKFPLLIAMFAKLKVAVISLFTLISAHPIGALITVLGLAAGALLLFANRSGEAKEKLHELGTEIDSIDEKLGKQLFVQLVSGFERLNDGSYAAIGSIEKLAASLKSMTRGELESLQAYLNTEVANALRAVQNETNSVTKAVLNNKLAEYQKALGLVNGELEKYIVKSNETSDNIKIEAGLLETAKKKLKELTEAREKALTKADIDKYSELIGLQKDEIENLEKIARLTPENIASKTSTSVTSTSPLKPMELPPPPDFDAAAHLAAAKIRAYREKVSEEWSSAWEGIKNVVASGIADLSMTIGESLGNMLSGIDPNFGAGILSVIGNFIKQLGGLLIQFGSISLAFKILQKQMSIPSALAAIAVGIAAVAAGTILLNKAKGGPQGMAEGGIVPPGFPGDTYPALLTSGEKVVPAAIPLPNMGGGAQEITVKLIGKLSGSDILLSTERASLNRNRVRGY